MSPLVKRSFIAGLGFTILGSFLPWGIHGDLVSYNTYGIQFFPAFEDNGGVFIVLLCALISWFVFRPPAFLKYPPIWIFASSAGIAMTACFHIQKWIVAYVISTMIGAPIIKGGLFVVLVGALMLLIASSVYYFRMSRKEI